MPVLVESQGVPTCHSRLYNSNGQVLNNQRFDPYGNVLRQSGYGSSVYGFTGEVNAYYATLIPYVEPELHPPQE